MSKRHKQKGPVVEVTENAGLEDKVFKWLMNGGESPLPTWPDLPSIEDGKEQLTKVIKESANAPIPSNSN